MRREKELCSWKGLKNGQNLTGGKCRHSWVVGNGKYSADGSDPSAVILVPTQEWNSHCIFVNKAMLLSALYEEIINLALNS